MYNTFLFLSNDPNTDDDWIGYGHTWQVKESFVMFSQQILWAMSRNTLIQFFSAMLMSVCILFLLHTGEQNSYCTFSQI